MSERLRQWRHALFLGYHRMFQRYPWQWICHLTFNDDYSSDVVNEILIRWTRNLQINEHIQIAYVKVICFRRDHPHIHLLMLGKGKYKGKKITLEDISHRKWESKWPYFAEIEPIEDHFRSTRYEALQTFKFKCDEYEIDFYNLKLLKQLWK